jgi:predicted Zn-dependent peptidase
VLIVVGCVKAEDVFKEAQDLFGNIKSVPVPQRVRVKNALTGGIHHTICYYSDKVESEKVAIMYNCPSKRDGIEKCHALDLGLDALFSDVVFKFSRHFIDKRNIVSSLNCMNEWDAFDPKPLCIQASLMPNVTSEKFLAEFEKKIAEIVKRGISAEEFNLAKKCRTTKLVYHATDGHRRIRLAFADLARKFDLSDIENVVDQLDGITLEQVNEVLKEVFSRKPFAVVKISPEKLQGKDGRK